MTGARAVMLVERVFSIGELGYLNSSCFRKSMTLMFLKFLQRKNHAFVAKLSDICFCWFPAAMLVMTGAVATKQASVTTLHVSVV